MTDDPVCKCGHKKSMHSAVKPHRCNQVIEVVGYQDGHWEEGYCTCSYFHGIQSKGGNDGS